MSLVYYIQMQHKMADWSCYNQWKGFDLIHLKDILGYSYIVLNTWTILAENNTLEPQVIVWLSKYTHRGVHIYYVGIEGTHLNVGRGLVYTGTLFLKSLEWQVSLYTQY